MRRIILTIVMALAVLAPVERVSAQAADEKVLTAADQMPVYIGGDAAMYKDISANLVYPAMAAEEGIQGRVVVQFVVRKDGSVGEVKVFRGVDPSLDREAVRVVKTLKKFNPGRVNGEPVNVWYTLPISFKLSTGSTGNTSKGNSSAPKESPKVTTPAKPTEKPDQPAQKPDPSMPQVGLEMIDAMVQSSAGDKLVPGEPFMLTVVVNNTYKNAAVDAVVMLNLPAGVTVRYGSTTSVPATINANSIYTYEYEMMLSPDYAKKTVEIGIKGAGRNVMFFRGKTVKFKVK